MLLLFCLFRFLVVQVVWRRVSVYIVHVQDAEKQNKQNEHSQNNFAGGKRLVQQKSQHYKRNYTDSNNHYNNVSAL